jgi:hypothetical protein
LVRKKIVLKCGFEACAQREIMMRRSSAMILATAVALAVAGFGAFVAGPGVSPLTNLLAKKPERVMLVYVGADDCALCQIWQRDHAPTVTPAPGQTEKNLP